MIINHAVPFNAMTKLVEESAKAVLKERGTRFTARFTSWATFSVTAVSGTVQFVIYKKTVRASVSLSVLYRDDPRHLQQLNVLRQQIIDRIEKELADV
jgi:hypothetical protein